ncbi:membrane protein insertase YidC [Candidatus Poribacteria bacterium]|nr:membrane protein insertase YidC [Candidatus Poribacteria bacterium]
MDKRYILALVLITVVMIGWMFLQPIISPRKSVRQRQSSTPSVQKETAQPEGSKEAVIVPQGEKETQTEYQELSEGDKAIIETNYYEAEFFIKTATISSWKLKNYLKRDSKSGESIDLIPPPNVLLPTYKHCSGITFPELAENIKWYEVDNQKIILEPQEEKSSITFKGIIEDKLKVTKKYTFHQDSYLIDLEITFDNLANQRFPENEGNSRYILRWGPGITSDDKKGDGGYGAKVHRPPKSESKNEPPIIWAAMHSRYFAAAIIPDGKLNAQYKKNDTLTSQKQVEYVTSPSDAADVIIPGFTLNAGEHRTDQFTLYIGPKEDNFLKQVRAPVSDEPVDLNKLIQLGFFGWLAKGLLWLLNAIYAVTKNYGIAIIVITTLLKVVIYPLTRKSQQSMVDMQKLKGPLEELKEKYRDDPQKLNKATMRLYKEHGINPLSGCIVWLPQIPIFWAFFSALREAIELRGAGFTLWINDLSTPDTLATLPIITANGIPIRILPLLMGVAMYFQQKLGGAPGADPRQSKIMSFMPIIFTFFFYGFPSGLVLYWLWNNVLTIAQQYMMSKKGNDTGKVEPQIHAAIPLSKGGRGLSPLPKGAGGCKIETNREKKQTSNSSRRKSDKKR